MYKVEDEAMVVWPLKRLSMRTRPNYVPEPRAPNRLLLALKIPRPRYRFIKMR